MANNKPIQYDHAIFFDNNKSHYDDVKTHCPGIDCILVDETYEQATKVLFEQKDLATIIDSLTPNTYIEFIKKLHDGDYYDKQAGINQADIRTFYLWEKDTSKSSKRALLLDWDRTITKIEGFVLFPLSLNINLNDILAYLCGGHERLTMIRSWLADVNSKNIDIFIVTNNTGCNSLLFHKLVTTLVPTINLNQIICGMNFDFHKSLAIMNDPRFIKLGMPFEKIHEIYYPTHNNIKFTHKNLDKLINSTLHNMNAGKRRNTRRRRSKLRKTRRVY